MLTVVQSITREKVFKTKGLQTCVSYLKSCPPLAVAPALGMFNFPDTPASGVLVHLSFLSPHSCQRVTLFLIQHQVLLYPFVFQVSG